MALIDPPIVTPKTAAQFKGEHLLGFPHELFKNMLHAYNSNVSILFDTPETADIFTELGTSGGELFDFLDEIKTFLESLKQGSTTDAQAKFKPFTVNPDGSVTLT